MAASLQIRRGVIVLVLFLFSTASFNAQGQPSAASGETAATSTAGKGPRRHLATIVFAGLGGAVLGLSTLSFYGRPQDYLANIAIGFGVGIITGTIYVTYKALSEPDRFYGPVEGAGPLGIPGRMSDPRALAQANAFVPQMGFTLSF